MGSLLSTPTQDGLSKWTTKQQTVKTESLKLEYKMRTQIHLQDCFSGRRGLSCILNNEDLERSLHGKEVIFIGDPDSNPFRNNSLTTIARRAAASTISYLDSGLNIPTPLVERWQESWKNYIYIIISEAYGPAFTQFCRSLPVPVLTLLPLGCICLAWPNAFYRRGGAMHAALFDKKIPNVIQKVAIFRPHNLKNSLRQLLSSNPCKTRQFTYFDTKPNFSDIHLAGPDILHKTEYDLVVTSSQDISLVYPIVNSLSNIFTPILCLDKNNLHLSHPNIQNELFISHRYEELNEENYFILYDKYEASLEHLKKLTSINTSTRFANGMVQHVDFKSECYTVKNGKRRTYYQPDSFEFTIHLFGNSIAYGIHNDDRYTISSFLQNKVNQNKIPARVVNSAISGISIPLVANQIFNSDIRPGDVVLILHHFFSKDIEPATELEAALSREILEFVTSKQACCFFYLPASVHRVTNPSQYETVVSAREKFFAGWLMDADIASHESEKTAKTRELFSSKGVDLIDLQPFFDRPHTYGELFVNWLHLGPEGNRMVAEALFQTALENYQAPRTAKHQPLETSFRLIDDYSQLIRRTFENDPQLLSWLDATPRFNLSSEDTGSIVMNCNPFTRGHRHILEKCLTQVKGLYLFVVEEDKSFFSFKDRLQMIIEGTRDISHNIHIVPSGKFILSSMTFPEYFNKENLVYTPDTTTEVYLFGALIAPALSIGNRFIGEEPFCSVTKSYHSSLKKILPTMCINVVEISRYAYRNQKISASQVRRMIKSGKFEELLGLVPESTYNYLIHRAEHLN